jgi:hypothetical protein
LSKNNEGEPEGKPPPGAVQGNGNGDIFDKPDRLLKIWENERTTRNFNTQLMWENIKFFVGLVGVLLSAHMVLLGFFWNIMDHGSLKWPGIALLVFPSAISLVSYLGWKDSQMRWQRFLLVATHLLKLEDLLGLHVDISGKLTYFKDKYLFPDYQRNFTQYEDYEDFRI